MKWTTAQPQHAGLYIRATINGDLLGLYELRGTAMDPRAPSQWFGPIPKPPSYHHDEDALPASVGGDA